MIDFEHARKQMVDTQLRPGNITDRRVLAVMGAVAREKFVPAGRRDLAYIDDIHALTAGSPPRYLPAPAPFGKLLQLAAIKATDSILDVGCASGYSTAVLAGLGAAVVGVENEPELVAQAIGNLAATGIGNATILQAPPEAGAEARGPFDVIVVEGTVDAVPEALLAQLQDHGRLVALIRAGATAVAHLYVRAGKDVAARSAFNASLPPLAVAKRPQEFVF